jgi:CO dehydrogenase/acetyl-CoA synthase gamma subunit (corrinoid Fe-S protein)
MRTITAARSDRILKFRKAVEEYIVRSSPICLCWCNGELLRNDLSMADLNVIKSISHGS